MEFDYTILINFLLSMKWLWIIVIILLYNLINKVLNIFIKKLSLDSDNLIKNTQYKEDDIINHLDYIIKEALDEYILLNIKPKEIYYINTKMENMIIDYLSDEIPKRLSKTLITHLSFIYNNEYIGEFIGKHIYMIVLEYVLDYNMNSAQETKNNK